MYQLLKGLKKRIIVPGDFSYECKIRNLYYVGGEEVLMLSTLGSSVVGCCCFLLGCQIGGLG